MQSIESQSTEIKPAKRGRGRPRRIERPDDLLAPCEVARRLGFSPATVGNWISRGLLEHVKVMGRVRVTVRAVEGLRKPSAVEQSARTIERATTRQPRRMGSAGGKICEMARGQVDRAGSASNGLGSGEQPLPHTAEISDNESHCAPMVGGYTREAADGAGFDQGGRGSDSIQSGDGADGFGQGENFHIASALPG